MDSNLIVLWEITKSIGISIGGLFILYLCVRLGTMAYYRSKEEYQNRFNSDQTTKKLRNVN